MSEAAFNGMIAVLKGLVLPVLALFAVWALKHLEIRSQGAASKAQLVAQLAELESVLLQLAADTDFVALRELSDDIHKRIHTSDGAIGMRQAFSPALVYAYTNEVWRSCPDLIKMASSGILTPTTPADVLKKRDDIALLVRIARRRLGDSALLPGTTHPKAFSTRELATLMIAEGVGVTLLASSLLRDLDKHGTPGAAALGPVAGVAVALGIMWYTKHIERKPPKSSATFWTDYVLQGILFFTGLAVVAFFGIVFYAQLFNFASSDYGVKLRALEIIALSVVLVFAYTLIAYNAVRYVHAAIRGRMDMTKLGRHGICRERFEVKDLKDGCKCVTRCGIKTSTWKPGPLSPLM